MTAFETSAFETSAFDMPTSAECRKSRIKAQRYAER